MQIISDIGAVQTAVAAHKMAGKRIGFVPTMGYLHEGHLSLVRESVQRCDLTIVSIFVNPSQFAPHEDFAEYPRDLKKDAALLEQAGVDLIFAPSAEDIYPPGYRTYVEVTELQEKLCGVSRPHFFRGVCTIVLKLFNIIMPDFAFFGQKDAQQAVILQKMVLDLNLTVHVEILPIVRDSRGLALSSRNDYLSPEQYQAALCLFRSLDKARKAILNGEKDSSRIYKLIKTEIEAEPLAKVDYISIVDLKNLDQIPKIDGPVLIAIAVFIGKVRLIDNLII